MESRHTVLQEDRDSHGASRIRFELTRLGYRLSEVETAILAAALDGNGREEIDRGVAEVTINGRITRLLAWKTGDCWRRRRGCCGSWCAALLRWRRRKCDGAELTVHASHSLKIRGDRAVRNFARTTECRVAQRHAGAISGTDLIEVRTRRRRIDTTRLTSRDDRITTTRAPRTNLPAPPRVRKRPPASRVSVAADAWIASVLAFDDARITRFTRVGLRYGTRHAARRKRRKRGRHQRCVRAREGHARIVL